MEFFVSIVTILFLLYLLFFNNVIETMEIIYKEPPNIKQDPIYLSKLNAANIEFLKSKLDSIEKMHKEIVAMEDTVNANSIAVQHINTSMQNVASNSIPSSNVQNKLIDTGNTIPPGKS